jgi:L-lactate dehydrogenase complex protein LldG
VSETSADTYDLFETRAGDYGVELTRVEPSEAPEAIAAAVEEPAVGAPLPWDEVSLPSSVPTDPTPAQLEAAVTGVSGAELGVADYGSIVLRQDVNGSEPISLFIDKHVAVLREEDIVPDMEAAFAWLGEEFREKRDSAILATGPSATADMGALVQGAHGAKTVEVIVLT